MSDNQLATAQPRNVREALALPAYRERFSEVLRDRAPQFMSALIQLAQDPHLARCDPRSVIGAAMIAATLELPIEKSLGQAHIVNYDNQAQFQLGWKGYVQLAHRSGQYARLNAKPVNAEAFAGFDEVGEPIIDWSKLDETLPPVGYAFACKLVNGFTKVCYWPRAKVEAHAKRFSKAYAKGFKSSPWFTNFDAMALKTVVMNELRQWGVLSVQMQTALERDQAVIKDVGAEPEFIDNESAPLPSEGEVVRPAPKPRAKRGVNAALATQPSAEEPKDMTQEPVGDPEPEGQRAAPDEIPGDPPPPRKELKDGETITVTAHVREILILGKTSPKPYIQALIDSPQFAGLVYHLAGAPGGTPLPEWESKGPVKIAMQGVFQKAKNAVAAIVSSVTSEGAAADLPGDGE